MFRKANMKDLPKIMELTEKTVKYMNEVAKIDQWDNGYPNAEVFTNDIEQEELYVYELDKQLVGVICLNYQPYPQYDQVTWRYDKPFLTIHRLMVSPNVRRQNIGSQLLKAAEKVALTQGIDYLKIDTYSLNLPMNKLILKNDYYFLGTMDFVSGKACWNCYDKELKL